MSARGLSATVSTDYKFLDPLIEDLKLTLVARNRYLGCLDTDRPATRGNSRGVA
jgi:hypothetical protein